MVANAPLSHLSTKPRSEEFIMLFNLFERLASRGSRNGPQHRSSTTEQDFPSIPADLEPIVQNLAVVVGNRRSMEVETLETRQRARSKTLSGSSANEVNGVVHKDDPLAHFPLNKECRFTFTLMLHKLYQLDDWAEKVQQVLSKSRSEFKPLAEALGELESKRERNPRSTPPCPRSRPPNDVSNRHRRLPPRLRAQSLSTSYKQIPEPIRPTRSQTKAAVSEHKPVATVEDAGDLRVVKKRCIDRRRSEEFLIGRGAQKVGRAWVYIAVVTAREVYPRPTVVSQPACEIKSTEGKYGRIGYGAGGRRRFHNRWAVSIGGQAGQDFVGKRWTVTYMDDCDQVNGGKPIKRQREL